MSNDEKPGYRLLTGEDNDAFCRRVSSALEDGYQLYGSPACTFDPNTNRMLVAQAVLKHDFGGR
ncbi:MAG: DUF1737 domain-containing protein [Sneathiella sp.]|nr:DUF1737 domain-containing protein [Sneathiella sp.]